VLVLNLTKNFDGETLGGRRFVVPEPRPADRFQGGGAEFFILDVVEPGKGCGEFISFDGC
jgi:hypothetical protein